MCLVSLTSLADNQVITGTANTSATAAIWNQNLTELAGMSLSLCTLRAAHRDICLQSTRTLCCLSMRRYLVVLPREFLDPTY
jgi:hypothetical protein